MPGFIDESVAKKVFAGVMIMLTGISARAQTPTEATSSVATKIETQAPRRKADVQWKMDLRGDSFANERDQAQIVGFGLRGEMRYRLADTLLLKANAGVTMQSGYAQTRFGDSAPRSGLDLKEAFVQYRPLTFFAVQAGALNQGQLSLPLLISERAFPGVLEKVVVGSKRLGLELRAQQTIPTSTQLSTKTVDAEPSPSFLSETLLIKTTPFEFLALEAHGTHFAFHQLPSQVAMESAPFGNTLDDDGRRFVYGYQGWAAGGDAKITFVPGFAWGFGGNMIQNLDAPEGFRNAQHLSTRFEIGLPGDIDLIPKGEVFFAESDVAPAFYNDAGFGHTNRQGWAAELQTVMKTKNLTFGARYVSADVINASALQSRQEYILLKLGTLYDSIF